MQNNPSKIILENVYDSHVHWLGTGMMNSMLDLSTLKNIDELSNLKVNQENFRGEWLIGFGWDQNKWNKPESPHRKVLDHLFPSHLVSFIRADGHGTWVNSKVLQLLGILNSQNEVIHIPKIDGGKIEVDSDGMPTGVLLDNAKSLVDKLIPSLSSLQIAGYLIKGMQTFHRNGITHIRDMSCSESQWNESVKLCESGLLKLAIEQCFSAEDPKDFDKAFDLAKRAVKNHPTQIRPKSLKIYFDGALGSEGALISKPYSSGSGNGFSLMNASELKEFIIKTWSIHLEISIHTIGDEAAHQVVLAANDLWNDGYQGLINLEHAQMLREDTIQLMKQKPITCYMQPCHWLSDKRWLKTKVHDLFNTCFPWRALEENQIKFYFGSDSPIEKPNIFDNQMAIQDAALQGISPTLMNSFHYQTHPDKTWIKNCFSEFEDQKCIRLHFDNQRII